MAIVTAKNLAYSIHGRPILGPLDFEVPEGSFVAFIGPSGCGKTTLLNIIARITKNHSGSLSVNAGRISFVFQHDSLLEWKTAIENVLLPFTLQGAGPSESESTRGKDVLRLVGLEDYEAYYPSQLSGGMKKRVEIARALVTNPDLLILDEPFSSLDIITREKLNVLVRNLHALRKTTVILVTHSVEEACFLSEQLYVLSPLPGTILRLKELRRSKSENGAAMFVLSESQQSINSEIRREAAVLWDPAAPEAGRRLPPARSSENRKAGLREFWYRHWSAILMPLELVVIFLALRWVKRTFAVPDIIFPDPGAILSRFLTTLGDGTILPDLKMTMVESLSGFTAALCISLVVGFVIARSRTASRIFMPYLIGANTIPSVALAPFLVLWFGFGLTPRIITSVIVIFFPLLINTTAAFREAEDRVRHLKAFFRPGWARSLFAMELPAAVPGIFNGIKISITLSVIGAVVGEFVSGHEGLGALVSRAKAKFDIELMFVGLMWLVVLGITYYAAAAFLHRLVQGKRRVS